MEIGNLIAKLVLIAIGAVVFITVGFALSPSLVDAVDTLNVTGVTLGSVITTISDYLPFLYLLGICVAGIAMVLRAQSAD